LSRYAVAQARSAWLWEQGSTAAKPSPVTALATEAAVVAISSAVCFPTTSTAALLSKPSVERLSALRVAVQAPFTSGNTSSRLRTSSRRLSLLSSGLPTSEVPQSSAGGTVGSSSGGVPGFGSLVPGVLGTFGGSPVGLLPGVVGTVGTVLVVVGVGGASPPGSAVPPAQPTTRARANGARTNRIMPRSPARGWCCRRSSSSKAPSPDSGRGT